MLSGFSDKDMIEQIVMLDEIKDSGRTEALPGLMELYARPLTDQAVDEMVYHTLFELLARDHEAVIAGLRHPAERVRLVAVRRAGEDRVPAARSILIEQLQTTMEPETLAATINSLSQYADPALVELITPFIDHEDHAVAASAMHGVVALHGESGRSALQEMIERKEQETSACGVCSLKRAQAMSCLGKSDSSG